VEDTEPSEKYANIINSYQAENEEMRRELASLKNKDKEDSQERKNHAAQNIEIMQELLAMKEVIEEKDRALVKHRLEAALHSKAILMVNSETVTKLVKVGTIEKFGKAGKSKAKEKWVEVHVHSAQSTPEGIKRGFLMLTYSDSKTSRLSTRFQIIGVKEEARVGGKVEGKAFSLEVFSSGTSKELVFACKDEKAKWEWVLACSDGLDIVKEEFLTLKSENDLILDVEFTKPKLGIRVEERVFKTSAGGKKLTELEGNKFDTEDENKEGKPCELVVKVISDESLITTGLKKDCVVSAINGINLRGLTYNEQIDMFSSVQKPYTVTFIKRRATTLSGILKELVVDGDNAVKSVFYELIKGTPFGIKLDKSENKTATIAELLSNQRKLIAVLTNTIMQKMGQ